MTRFVGWDFGRGNWQCGPSRFLGATLPKTPNVVHMIKSDTIMLTNYDLDIYYLKLKLKRGSMKSYPYLGFNI